MSISLHGLHTIESSISILNNNFSWVPNLYFFMSNYVIQMSKVLTNLKTVWFLQFIFKIWHLLSSIEPVRVFSRCFFFNKFFSSYKWYCAIRICEIRLCWKDFVYTNDIADIKYLSFLIIFLKKKIRKKKKSLFRFHHETIDIPLIFLKQCRLYYVF